MRLGIFGGTFDPPHVGHFLVAMDALERLALDRLVFVPAASQPLKGDSVSASAAQRLQMARLMAGADGRFSVDPIEIDRAGLSYTVETLAEYERRHSDAERFFLVGADAVALFAKWREPERIMRLARLVVLRRAVDAGAPGVGELDALRSEPWAGQPPIELETRRVDVSSTEVRARVRAGKSIRGFVPDAVAEYVERSGLYR